MKSLRAAIVVWLLIAIASAFYTDAWASWPLSAQVYARETEYAYLYAKLPYAWRIGFGGCAFMLVGAMLLTLRLRLGRALFIAGLVCHAYYSYLAIPTIASSEWLALRAGFYVLAGVVIGMSHAANLSFLQLLPEKKKTQ